VRSTSSGGREDAQQFGGLDRLDEVGVEAGLLGAAPVLVRAVAGDGVQPRPRGGRGPAQLPGHARALPAPQADVAPHHRPAPRPPAGAPRPAAAPPPGPGAAAAGGGAGGSRGRPLGAGASGVAPADKKGRPPRGGGPPGGGARPAPPPPPPRLGGGGGAGPGW